MHDIAKFLYEVGQLKRVKRSGWWCVGVKDPESVSEHSHRTAVLGYLLAQLAGADPYKTMTICLFHDVSEARINDAHAVTKRYVDQKAAEKDAYRDQLRLLPPVIAGQLQALEYRIDEADTSPEHELATDADVLECLIQAIEYRAVGYADTDDFINSSLAKLKHPISKEVAQACLETPPSAWWKSL